MKHIFEFVLIALVSLAIGLLIAQPFVAGCDFARMIMFGSWNGDDEMKPMFTVSQLELHEILAKLRALCGEDLAYEIQSAAMKEYSGAKLVESLKDTLSLMHDTKAV